MRPKSFSAEGPVISVAISQRRVLNVRQLPVASYSTCSEARREDVVSKTPERSEVMAGPFGARDNHSLSALDEFIDVPDLELDSGLPFRPLAAPNDRRSASAARRPMIGMRRAPVRAAVHFQPLLLRCRPAVAPPEVAARVRALAAQFATRPGAARALSTENPPSAPGSAAPIERALWLKTLPHVGAIALRALRSDTVSGPRAARP